MRRCEITDIENQFDILAGSAPPDEHRQALKHGDTFGLFDHFGDIMPHGLGEQGLYHEGTRFISRLNLRLGRSRPLFLSTNARTNELLVIDLANPDVYANGQFVPRGTLHIYRTKFLWQGVCYERLRISNFGLEEAEVDLALEFDADFADIFEVRGTKRKRRGQRYDPKIERDDTILLQYLGLDGVLRSTRVRLAPAPANLSESTARFRALLAPKQHVDFYINIVCEIGSNSPRVLSYIDAFHDLSKSLRTLQDQECRISSSNEHFDAWVNRSIIDLRMMITSTPHGMYPFAGVPWFSTVFGRDGIVTALETLWFNPEISAGVLRFLAAHQADSLDAASDAEPGKILHEMRSGEMAALGEIPFGRYYGTVDATPLFVVLAGAYYRNTGDRRLIESIWPSIERALFWIDNHGDADKDGFVEYRRQSENGLFHMGWKDSRDSIFHADGALAEGPIALCEVQGYVYAAKRRAAQLASVLGNVSRAEQLEREAADLKEKFEQAFWCEDLETYALALDGRKRPCRVRTSNAGHCLFAGIASTGSAARLAKTLRTESSFSGWGVRTVDASHVRYNPMSYHNGSVWPHDNAIVAYGLSLYGYNHLAVDILDGMFGLSQTVNMHRLPELFCGFLRRNREGPTLYPVACAPQAWAAGAVFMLLQACLGMELDAPHGRIRFEYPVLPSWIDGLQIKGLRVGDASLDLTFHRYPDNVGINVDRRSGKIDVVVLK